MIVTKQFKLQQNTIYESLNAKTIAITGSNGKTTTKDIITSVLSTKYKVHKTQGNFNNELGVPITILAAPEDSEILVLEMVLMALGNSTSYLNWLTDYTVILIL